MPKVDGPRRNPGFEARLPRVAHSVAPGSRQFTRGALSGLGWAGVTVVQSLVGVEEPHHDATHTRLVSGGHVTQLRYEGRRPPAIEYVTLLDEVYLPQGLALHESIQRFDPTARLTVYAMDEISLSALSRLSQPGLHIRSGLDRMPQEFHTLRGHRDWVSLLWTSTPFVIADALSETSSGSTVIYIDADMALFRSPAPVIEEFEASGREVLLTSHNFAADYDAASSVGEFAVQFIGFRPGAAQDILDTWSRQCLHACPLVPGGGSFGDQKYLDSWPDDFPLRIHIASNPEWFQGPWNAVRFPASRAIAYHFHGLRLVSNSRVRLTTHYRLPEPTVDTLYVPYVAALQRAVGKLHAIGLKVPAQAKALTFGTRVRQFAGRIRRTWRDSGGPRHVSISPRVSPKQI